MLRDCLANVLRRVFIAHLGEMAQRDVADIFIETMLLRIAVPVGFIGAHRMFIPLAGKHALPANRLETMTNAADTGKQIDEAESIMRMMRRRLRQERAQVGLLLRSYTTCRARYRRNALQYSRAPVLLADGNQLREQRFDIIYRHQLAQ